MEQLFKYFIGQSLIPQIYALSIFVPILAALPKANRVGTALTIFFVYELISFVLTVSQMYLAAHKINNLWLIHLQTPIEFGFFVWVFSLWQDDAFVKRFFRLTIPVFFCLWLILAFFVEKIDEFNTFSKPTEAILLIVASGYCLFKVNQEKVESLFSEPSFWISSGTLVYFTGTVIIFTVTNLLLHESLEELRMVYQVVFVMETIANLFYAGGFLCRRLAPA